jgi:2-methylisocitrate lyase-like PEP mutase family enzyme
VIVRAEAAMTEVEDKTHLIRRYFRMKDELSAIDEAADRLRAAADQGRLTDELAEEVAGIIKENTAKLKQE